MSGDRPRARRHLRSVEVMNMSEVDRSTAEIARLFDVAGGEDEAISRLDGCVSRLREVQAAKVLLARISGTELRAALEYRRRALDSESA